MEEFESLAKIATDLTLNVVLLALLFAERRAHDATRIQLEKAREEHLGDLRSMAYTRREMAAYEQQAARYPYAPTIPAPPPYSAATEGADRPTRAG